MLMPSVMGNLRKVKNMGKKRVEKQVGSTSAWPWVSVGGLMGGWVVVK